MKLIAVFTAVKEAANKIAWWRRFQTWREQKRALENLKRLEPAPESKVERMIQEIEG